MEYLPYRVYRNLEKFAEYKRLELVQGAIYSEHKKRYSTFLTQDEFTKNIQYYNYVLMEFQDKSDKERKIKGMHPNTKDKKVITYILLFDPESDYTSSTQKFTKILNRIPEFSDEIRKNNLEIIIISYRDLSIHLEKKIEANLNPGTENSGYIRIFPYKYLYFTSERPIHKLVSQQRILSKKESDKILEELCLNKQNLPKIKKTDPIMIWLGAELGDIIEALMPSEVSGIETKYFLVRT